MEIGARLAPDAAEKHLTEPHHATTQSFRKPRFCRNISVLMRAGEIRRTTLDQRVRSSSLRGPKTPLRRGGNCGRTFRNMAGGSRSPVDELHRGTSSQIAPNGGRRSVHENGIPYGFQSLSLTIRSDISTASGRTTTQR